MISISEVFFCKDYETVSKCSNFISPINFCIVLFIIIVCLCVIYLFFCLVNLISPTFTNLCYHQLQSLLTSTSLHIDQLFLFSFGASFDKIMYSISLIPFPLNFLCSKLCIYMHPQLIIILVCFIHLKTVSTIMYKVFLQQISRIT